MCQIEDQVDMRLQDGAIIIKPVKQTLRDGWFASNTPSPMEAIQKDNETALDWDGADASDDSEWQW